MLVTFEMDEARARRARENFARAGVADRANVIVGDVQRMLAKVAGPFDLIFQDGDKRLYTPLLDRLVALLRPGGLLVTDNVLWDGEVAPGFKKKPTRDPADTKAIAEYNERLNAHPELMTAIVPLRDGVAISVKRRATDPLLQTVSRASDALRRADFNDDARGD
jgi:predicted O-methyltransferase YrrM